VVELEHKKQVDTQAEGPGIPFGTDKRVTKITQVGLFVILDIDVYQKEKYENLPGTKTDRYHWRKYQSYQQVYRLAQ